jgi:hypothetical protein
MGYGRSGADAPSGHSAEPEPSCTVSAVPVPNAVLVAIAAQRFCAELCEDADGVPQPELRALHEALDAWEATHDDA